MKMTREQVLDVLNLAARFGARVLGYAMILLAVLGLVDAATLHAFAQTDLTGTITSVSGYWTAAEVIGISILLFVVGRKVIRKI